MDLLIAFVLAVVFLAAGFILITIANAVFERRFYELADHYVGRQGGLHFHRWVHYGPKRDSHGGLYREYDWRECRCGQHQTIGSRAGEMGMEGFWVNVEKFESWMR